MVKVKIIKKPVVGVACFQGPQVFGEVLLKESVDGKKMTVRANLSGLEPNQAYAWHIHEAGDLRGKGCLKACAHYNPTGVTHGGPKSRVHHVGDLGNLRTNAFGESQSRLTVDFVKLRGKKSVLGRSLVIHEGKDDLGLGGTEESLKTGSAGTRIGCAVIGYAENSQLYF